MTPRDGGPGAAEDLQVPEDLRDSRDEPITCERVFDAARLLDWTRAYEPHRELTDDVPWMRVVRTVPELVDAAIRVLAKRQPANDGAATAEPIPTNGAPQPTRAPDVPAWPADLPQLERPELENLRESGLTDEAIRELGPYTTRDAVLIDEIAGRELSQTPRIDPADKTRLGRDVELVAMVIPCHQPDGTCVDRLRLRHPTPAWDHDARRYVRDSETGRYKPAKYTSPQGVSPPLSWPRDARSWLRDPTIPLFVVEGEKKRALLEWVLRRLGVAALVIGLPGIDNAHDAAYARAELARGVPKPFALRLRPELLEHVALTGRRAVICFDYYRDKDEAHFAEPDNPKRRRAREPFAAQNIADMLYDEGASEVRFCSPPTKATKGVDDLYETAARGGRPRDLTRDCADTLDADVGCAAVKMMLDGACLLYHSHGDGPDEAVSDADCDRIEAELRSCAPNADEAPPPEPRAAAQTKPASPPTSKLATIAVLPGSAFEAELDVERVLASAGRVFVRGDTLVHVSGRRGPLPREYRGSETCLPSAYAAPWTSESLGSEISRVIDLHVWNYQQNNWGPGFAPAYLTKSLLDVGAHDPGRPGCLPPLTGVIEVPTITYEGRIICQPGYDAGSGLYLVPRTSEQTDLTIGETYGEARAAYKVLTDFVSDFPFVADHDRAAWVAYVLTIAGRYAVGGPVPVFVFSAPAKRTGKTHLSQIGSIIGAGYGAADFALGRGDEREKMLTSAVLRSTRTIRFDNIRKGTPFADTRIEQAVTTGTWSGRLLGSLRLHTGPWNAVVSATGIALTVGVEMSGRVVPCMLDAGMEHPEDRTGFQRPDIVAAALEELPKLSEAALTILCAHARAGRPRTPTSAPWGDYPAWCEVVRDAVIWASNHDPLGGRAALRQRVSANDPDAALLAALHAFGERRLGTGDPEDPTRWTCTNIASALAEPRGRSEPDAYSDLRGAVEEACRGRGRPAPGNVSRQLVAALVDPLVNSARGGYRLTATGSSKRGHVYRVELTHEDHVDD